MSWEGWEDAAVAPEKLGGYLRDLRKMMAAYGYKGSLYGHFGHGCVHTRINFDLQSKEGIAKFRKFMEEAADLVVSYGGSISGEHGDGQARGELLPKMFGPELVQAFREFKSAWDPEWKMNPGKLIDPYKLDENLRLGADYAPWEPKTNFQFLADHGSLAQATLRCVGVGKCRREEGGVMCPSYRATREEEHSTRGRAHLLWEMTQGQGRSDGIIRDGWRSEEVKQSLDLCLACKGCKSDCPVGVDVATYKAEFLSHYYEGRMRPRSAYAFGNIDLWARLASHAPGLANLTTQLPFLRDISKLVAGIPKQRAIPAFARETFKTWFHRRRQEDDRLEGERLFSRTVSRSETGLQPLRLRRRSPLARHLQQLFPSRHRQSRRRSPRSRRLPRHRPQSQSLLRTPALRPRHARPRPGAPAPDPRRTLPRNRSRNSHRRPRTQLRRRLPRRTPQSISPRRTRPSLVAPDFPAQRIPRNPRQGFPVAPVSTAKRSSTATAITNPS